MRRGLAWRSLLHTIADSQNFDAWFCYDFSSGFFKGWAKKVCLSKKVVYLNKFSVITNALQVCIVCCDLKHFHRSRQIFKCTADKICPGFTLSPTLRFLTRGFVMIFQAVFFKGWAKKVCLSKKVVYLTKFSVITNALQVCIVCCDLKSFDRSRQNLSRVKTGESRQNERKCVFLFSHLSCCHKQFHIAASCKTQFFHFRDEFRPI